MIKYPWNKFVALTVIVAPLIAMLCGATTVHYVDILNTGHDVPPYTNWATAALTIEDALALTASGSIVRVAAGIYLPTSSLTITNPTVRVESVSGAGSTMVCGDGTFSLFTFIAPGAAVCGFTLTNGGGSSAGGVLAAAASTVERCIVTGNNVLGNGGGLFANSVAALQVSDCMIVGNSADNGGGVYLQNAAAFVRNSICAFNSAPGKGAGIYAENAMIENCSVVSNTGQGVYLLQARVLNSIVYDNAAENIAGTSIALTNVCTMPDPGAGGIGVLTNNPRFVSAGGDFRLRCASPCIDLSTPAGWMTAAVDQYSSPRVSGVAPDLGAAEFPYPYLDITSHVGIASGPTNWVSFDVASLLLSGTNRYSITTNLYANALTTNLVVVGGMWAVNLAQGATSMFQAALGWHAPEVPLQTGANAIVVFGTNDVDGITNDILIVTRGADGTGTPFVDITNGTSASVNFDVTSYIIGGTNWQIAGGTLWWSNTLVAGATQFSASGANGAFSLAINNVQVGANVIRVYGTNMLGVCAGDTIMITRGADGTGTPFVDITNSTSVSVNFDVTSYAIGGTNWQIAGGTLWWSNTLVAGATQFSASAMNGAFSLAISNVQVGANVIRVYGTNMLGVCAGDTIMITRGADGTGTPFVDITNSTSVSVNFDVTSYAIGGTNWQIAGGTLWWSNTLVAGATQFSASAMNGAFSLAISNVQVGANVIRVYGTNMLGVCAGDTIMITRGADGTGTPFVDITNSTSVSVNFDVTSYAIGGTNWQIAGGTLWWSNTLVAGATQFSASAVNGAFSLLINNVQVGANVIRVYGTNMLGVCAGDTIMITRGADGTGTPFVDITNSTSVSVNFDVTSYAIGGTNWQIAGGTLWWSNTLVAGATQFSASAVNGAFGLLINNVQVGANVIHVYGTNMLGVCAGDMITITRGADGTGTPFVDITNGTSASVNFDVTSHTIGGTNWQIAGGTLWWSNTLVAGATQFSASSMNGAFSLLINNVQVGANVIRVYGTNMLGVCAGDMITITRQSTNAPAIEVLVNWPLHLQAGQIGWVEFVAQTGVQYGLYTAAMLTNGSGPLSSLIATNTAATLDFSVAQTQAGAQGPLLLYLAAMADMRSATQLPRTNVFVATVGPAVLKGKLRFFQIVESDGDIAEVYYAGLGTPRMEGRSVFITGAGVADTLYLKVTAPKKPAISDRRFPLDWVSAANLKSIKWHGQVDDIHISNVLKTVKISAGSLGFAYDRRAVSRHGLQVGAELRSVTVQAKKAKDGTCYGGSALGAFNVGPDAKAKGWMMKVSGISYKGLTGTVSTVTIDLCSHTLKALITKFADVIGTRVVVTNEIGMLAARSANIYDSYVVAHFMKTIVATAKKGYASGLIADSQFYSRGGDKQRIGIRAIKAYQFVDGHATNSNICLRKTIFAAGIIPPLCTNNLTSTFSIKTLTPKAAPLQGVFSSQLEFKNPRLRPAPAAPSYIKIINGALP